MMDRRTFLASSLALAQLSAKSGKTPLKPMALGLIIGIGPDPDADIAKVSRLGLTNCFLSMDAYIGKFSKPLAAQLNDALDKHNIQATTVEIVGPGRLVWDFLEGPSTIGLIPRETRRARIDALKQASDFARTLNVSMLQTHCGFIPENPKDPLFDEGVEAIREVARHCGDNGQNFLMETGQETPITLKRAIQTINLPNVGVGLDTANVILYGKANPVDALDVIGPYVKSVHAKDGLWPTDPKRLGEEVEIGKGRVDFPAVLRKLHQLGYRGVITIERETSGPQQIEDVRREKVYLERLIAQIQQSNS